MSNGNVYERLWKLSAVASKLVLDGNRAPEELSDLLQTFIEKNQNTYLRYLTSVTLGPANTTVTIAAATDVFTSYLDPDFWAWGTDQPGADTEAAKVAVYEMTKDGDYRTLFGSLGADPRSLCLSQGQIVEFCRNHRALLRQDGYGTFIAFAVGDELFVAFVFVDGGGLGALVYRFEHGRVWRAGLRHRLVVRQQTV